MKLMNVLIGAVSLIAAGTTSAQTTLSRSDQKFVENAAQAGLAEVAAGQVAMQKSTNDQVKQFAQMMVDDHTKANGQLAAIASGKGVALPEIHYKADGETKWLSKLTGPALNKRYAKLQVKDHAAAVKVFEKEAQKGRDADLRGFAADMLPTLKSHADKADALASAVEGGR